ncbi:DUF6950 family protein [Consotaella salsifontis]|uniref:DUF6950 domain-containing protein n=1 Tax=Consotaella salsifontis TaxID=1365950 RepID=A0A1T4SSW0_9HYPH|nr:hypothetical protein [Consotaella salsifontis]SKA30981.1 hypothetical protein SAMN05428963_11395 [Consotaella salsifontis]
MTRVTGWEKALVSVIERHAAMPFAWGKSDCGMLAADCVEAVLGEDLFGRYRGYSTELGAARKLKKGGFSTVEDVFSSAFEEVAPSLAQRGDVGVIERDGKIGAGVITSFGFACRGETSVRYEPITAVKRAFKVR